MEPAVEGEEWVCVVPVLRALMAALLYSCTFATNAAGSPMCPSDFEPVSTAVAGVWFALGVWLLLFRGLLAGGGSFPTILVVFLFGRF